MTIKELYAEIEGDYDQAMRVMCIEKLMDKHIRKLPANGIFADFKAAGQTLDAKTLFESAHAIKGVCANLGLVKLADIASGIAEEFRPGTPRQLPDEAVRQKLSEFDGLYNKTVEGIIKYEQSAG